MAETTGLDVAQMVGSFKLLSGELENWTFWGLCWDLFNSFFSLSYTWRGKYSQISGRREHQPGSTSGDPTGWNYHPPIVSSYVGQPLFELLANELPRIVSSQQVQYYPSINSTAQRRGRQEAERSANHTERPEHELDQTGQKY